MRTYLAACTAAGALMLSACSGGEKANDGAAANDTAAAGDTATASVDAPPAPKAGLWEMKITAAGMPAPQATKVCVGEPAPGTNAFTPPPGAGQTCAKNSVTKVAAGYEIDSECTIQGMTATSKGSLTGDFSSAYKIEMATKMSGPNLPAAAQQEVKTVIDAKYLGDCPADMKPGQSQTG